MHSMISRRIGPVVLALSAVAAVVASGATSATAGTSQAAPSPGTNTSPSAGGTTPAAPSGSVTTSSSGSPSGSASAAAATVRTRTGPIGTYLTDGQGRSLYLFVADTGNTSHCTGSCAAVWPPLLTNGNPQAAAGVTGGKLGTTTRPDGTKQVTYNNHPLYRYAPDQQPGDTKGQGLNNFGALWWLVTPGGSPITSSSSGSAAPGGSPGY
jgi:predicted lipoprotein with Yx(FWY)xxD motif